MYILSLQLILVFVVFLCCRVTEAAQENYESPLEITRQGASNAKICLSSWAYALDGSVKSTREIDRFLQENWDDESRKPIPGGLLVENFGVMMFALGSYVGEVLANLGGEWHFDEEDPQWGMTATITMRDGVVCCPAQRLMKRLSEGPENDFYFYTWLLTKNIPGATDDCGFVQVPPE